MRSRLLPAAAVLALLTGCGTTTGGQGVAPPGGVAQTGAAGAGGSSSSTGGSLGAPVGPEGAALAAGPGNTAGSSVGVQGGSTAAMGAPAPQGPVATGSSAKLGPGVSATEILIGRVRVSNYEAASAAFGSNTPAAPTDQYDKAMVDYVNSHGGLAGRKLKLDYYTLDATANKSTDQVEGEECAQWTQDHHVFAVLSGGTDNLRSCLAKRGVPMVSEGVFSGADQQTFATFRSYYEINAISLSHIADAMPDQLAVGGFLSPGATYGLLTWDDNQYVRSAKDHLKPAMAKRRLAFKQEAYVTTPKTTQESGQAVASLPNIVLQFKNAGVDHVVIHGDSGGALLAYFTKAAASQGYHPTYGTTSGSGPQALIDTQNVDPNELKGAVAASWNPIGDVGVKPYTKYGAGYRTCAAIMARAGESLTASSNNATIGTTTCDGFLFLKAAVDRAAPAITRDGFLAGAESLGDSYVSAATYRGSVTSADRDGVASLATVVYDASCTCFTYKGDIRRLR